MNKHNHLGYYSSVKRFKIHEYKSKNLQFVVDTGNGSVCWRGNGLCNQTVTSRKNPGNWCFGSHLYRCRCGHGKGETMSNRNENGEKIQLYRAWYPLWNVYWKRNWNNSIYHHEQCVIFYSSGIWDNPWIRNRKLAG